MTLIYNVPAEVYHRQPGLSSSGARNLLPPSCPARFKWEQDHQAYKDEAAEARENGPVPLLAADYDFGTAAHTFVLGKGEQIARLDYTDRRSKAYKEEAAAAREQGLVPLLAADYDAAAAMAKALRESPWGYLFTDGEAEVSAYWTDDQTGTQLRTRFDYLPAERGGRIVIPDYKTARSAEPGEWARSAFKYGYHVQAAWYIDTLTALDITDSARFVFVVQEKQPPYLVTPIELDAIALEIGRSQYRKAIDLYARCVETDTWPGYADDLVTVDAPAWLVNSYLDEYAPDEIEV